VDIRRHRLLHSGAGGQGGSSCAATDQKIYRSYNNGFVRNDSNHRYTTDLTVQQKMPAQGYAPEGIVMCAPLSSAQLEADAVRMLEQATFGASDAALAHVKAVGVPAFIEEQLAASATKYPVYPFFPLNRPDTCVNATAPPYNAASFCARDNYSLFQLQRQFFVQGATSTDQLRQRVGFALSQIFVISGVEGGLNQPYGMAEYEQMPAISRSTTSRTFSRRSHCIRRWASISTWRTITNLNGVQPKELRAETLQLFSIGTVELNLDGTPISMRTARRFRPTTRTRSPASRACSGWSYPPQPGFNARFNNAVFPRPDARIRVESRRGKQAVLGDCTGRPHRGSRSCERDPQHLSASNVAPFISRADPEAGDR
jgi:hypothetical protein